MKKLFTIILAVASILSFSSFTHGQGLRFQAPPQSSRYNDAYDQGFRQGEWDVRNNQSRSDIPASWRSPQERRDYEAGYRAGYYQTQASPSTPAQDRLVYRQGIRDGRSDAQLGRRANPQVDRWRYESDRRDYIAGYQRGHQMASGPDTYGLRTPSTRPSLAIDDHNKTVTWDAGNLQNARVFVKMDNEQESLFANARRGAQNAPWIQEGHLYVFTLRDINGRELTRQQLDLRAPSFWRGRFGN